MAEKLPNRWAYKHGAYYYRPRASERHLFDDKAWFRLAANYPDALRAYADRKELEVGDTLQSVIDRYRIDVMPLKKINTRRSYTGSLDRLGSIMGHNRLTLIVPKLVYQYMDNIARARTMNVANQDLKVLNTVLDKAVQWGAISANAIKGNVKYYGARDGLRKARERYVEDWELAEWQKVASPVQKAFAAITALTPERKSDILQITLPDITDEYLRIVARKTGKERRYQWTESLREAVDLALSVRQQGSLFLFTNRDGQCFVTDGRCASFDKAWRKSMAEAIEQTALEEPFTRHDLRAKVGSDADSDARAQALLGHESAQMTRKHYRRRVPLITPAK